jgi:choline dehydrogenase-like flavoprotein
VLGILAEFLPQAENRVTLGDEKDEYGMPIAHFNYNRCENDKKIVDFAKGVLMEIWDGAGAEDTLTIDRYAHLVGGARMGFTPDDSVVDSSHRVWGVDNLFIVDGSVMPTEGAANPALVIMALADRCASLLDRKLAA